MAKDLRYKTLKVMIETGNIKSITDLFNVIPKSVVAADLGINYVRFQSRLEKPGLFTLDELIRLASLIELDNMEFFKIIIAEVEKKKTTKRKFR